VATFKKVLAFLLFGAIAGAIAASVIAPGMITWYDTPGPGVPPGFDLSPHTRSVVSRLLLAQAIGAGLGGVALAIVGALIAKAQSKKSPAPSVPPPQGSA
jgi:hypothetical protein